MMQYASPHKKFGQPTPFGNIGEWQKYYFFSEDSKDISFKTDVWSSDHFKYAW